MDSFLGVCTEVQHYGVFQDQSILEYAETHDVHQGLIHFCHAVVGKWRKLSFSSSSFINTQKLGVCNQLRQSIIKKSINLCYIEIVLNVVLFSSGRGVVLAM